MTLDLSSPLRAWWRRLTADFLVECPPWKARSVRWAGLLALLGLGLAVLGWMRSDPGGGSVTAGAAWPAPLRLGLGYIGGFMLGWSLRRFLKLTLTLGLGALAAFLLLRQFNLLQVDWDSIEGRFRQSLGWVKAEAASLEELLKSRLPSAAAASVGGWMGFLFRVRRAREEEADETGA